MENSLRPPDDPGRHRRYLQDCAVTATAKVALFPSTAGMDSASARLLASLQAIAPADRREAVRLISLALDRDLSGCLVGAAKEPMISGMIAVPEAAGPYAPGVPVMLIRHPDKNSLYGVDHELRCGACIMAEDLSLQLGAGAWRPASAEEIEGFFQNLSDDRARRLATLHRCGELLYDATDVPVPF